MELTQQQVVAHRGYQKHYPENTLLSVHKAIEAGALHIEIDVQLSRDRVPMLYHDDTLDRMSSRSGKVSEYTAIELKKFSAHESQRFGQKFIDEKIASLSDLVEVIQINPKVTFYVELKEEAVKDHGIDVCLKQISDVLLPVMPQCVLISFDIKALMKAKAAGFNRVGPVLRDWATRNAVIDTLRASVMFINKKRIPPEDVIVAHCPVVAYEVDDPAEAKRLLQRGLAKIESFAVGELINSVCVS